MWRLFVNPDAFFERRSRDPSLRGPLVVVLLAGVTSAATTFALAPRVLSSVPEAFRDFALVVFGIASLYSLFAAVLLWIVYSGAFFLISHHLNGEGDFRRLVRLTGWGFLPAILSGFVGFLALYAAVQAGNTSAASIQSDPMVRVSRLLSQLFFLWQAFIWVFAVKWARDLSLRKAAVTVAIPVAVPILANLARVL